jgi:long-chain acyl-CoA synthetase
MLYDSWRRTAASCPNRLALLDLTSNRRWTFEELSSAVEREPRSEVPVAFPSGHSAAFVLGVLRAWRSRQIICPLEPGQPHPAFSGNLTPEVVHLKTTSATTGRPRFVALTAPQLMADAQNIVSTMGLRPEWPNVGLISLAHSYGYSNLVLPLLLHGIPLVIARGGLPEALREAAATQAEVTIPAVPALWRAWYEARAIPGNVRLAISAGAPLPLTVERHVFKRERLKIHNFYGSSECGGIAYDASSAPRSDETCVGTPLTGVEVGLARNGCLKVSGPAVGSSYWPDAGRKLRLGVFQTNDLAEIRGGRIFLLGRAGDRINVAGRKVAPETIERVLAEHGGVRECLVFGAPCSHARRGEVVVACVAPAAEASAEAIKKFAIRHLPDWQVPRQWWFVPSLEANRRGKISRADWRKKYLRKAQGKGHLRQAVAR